MFVLSCSWVALAALSFFQGQLNRTPFDFPVWIALWTVMGLIYYASIRRSQKQQIEISAGYLIFTTLGLALFYVSADTIFTTDLHRYLWDAQVWLQGENPLIHAPNSLSHLASERIPLPPDHSEIPSLYPPLAMFFFLLGRLILQQTIIYGILNIGILLVCSYLLHRHLSKEGKPTSRVLWFAWHPLLHFESVTNGHVEILGVLFLILFLLSMSRSNASHALLPLALGSLTKLWPWILSLDFLRSNRRAWIFSSTLLGGIFALYYLVWGDIQGLLTYVGRWEFFGLVYSLLRIGVDPLAARIFCLCIFAVLCLLFIRSKWSKKFQLGSAHPCLLAFLLLTPTLHPWYVLWLIPFFVWVQWSEWIYLSLAIALSYSVLPDYLENGVWQESLWAKALIYGPLVVGMFWRIGLSLKRTSNL